MRVPHESEKKARFDSRMANVNGYSALERTARNQASRIDRQGSGETPTLVVIHSPLETKPINIKCAKTSPASSVSLSRQSSVVVEASKNAKRIKRGLGEFDRIACLLDGRKGRKVSG